jgi:hypothetical protein
MTMKNKYAKRSKISEAKFRELLKLFLLNLESHSDQNKDNFSFNSRFSSVIEYPWTNA